MNALRFILLIQIISILVYTSLVGYNHGWNFLPVFFGDLLSLNWAGQFNFDFLCFLVLSGLWIMWRHQFSPAGIVLGLANPFGGIMFFAPYLLISSYKANGKIETLLLGEKRAQL